MSQFENESSVNGQGQRPDEQNKPGWVVVKQEAELGIDGNFVTKKVTYEKEKDSEVKGFRGMTYKDRQDLILKYVGLLGMLIAAGSLLFTFLNYQNSQQQFINGQISKAKSDSLNRISSDSTQAANRRKEQEEIRRYNKQSEQVFAQIAATLEASQEQAKALIEAANRQAKATFQKESQLYQIQVYGQAIEELSKALLHKADNEELEKTMLKLETEIQPKIALISNSMLLHLYSEVLHKLRYRQQMLTLNPKINKLDSLSDIAFNAISKIALRQHNDSLPLQYTYSYIITPAKDTFSVNIKLNKKTTSEFYSKLGRHLDLSSNRLVDLDIPEKSSENHREVIRLLTEINEQIRLKLSPLRTDQGKIPLIFDYAYNSNGLLTYVPNVYNNLFVSIHNEREQLLASLNKPGLNSSINDSITLVVKKEPIKIHEFEIRHTLRPANSIYMVNNMHSKSKSIYDGWNLFYYEENTQLSQLLKQFNTSAIKSLELLRIK